MITTNLHREEAVLLVYCANKQRIITLPLIIRKIEKSLFKDATSVYGYGGPIVSKKANSEDFRVFQEKLDTYFRSENIICIFSRLHPYLSRQEDVINTLGEIKTLGKVVNIDLSSSEEEQLAQYSKTTKRHLKKTKNLCSLQTRNDKDAIIKFIELYEENMNRVNAVKEYFFPKEYYLNLANATDFKTEFVFVVLKETGEIISGAMIIYTNTIVQYHLSGTLNEFLHLTPIRLILDEIRLKGKKEGYYSFNLGGGLGSNEDSLYIFKSSFSKKFKDFKIWKHIVNSKVYNKLCEKNIYLRSNPEKITFFPLYGYKKV